MSAVEHVYASHEKDLGGGFIVRRSLPQALRKMVGPFIFLDHMGPVMVPPGVGGVDVRPHPHIGLSTVTFLFSGEILHRDNLGSHQAIRPGDVNWMTAGSGIVHSERTSDDVRAAGQTVHGMQAWVALPVDQEECDASFVHHPKADLPVFDVDGAHLTVIAGAAFGQQSPVVTASPTLYVDVQLQAGATLPLATSLAEERAIYVVEGTVCVDPNGLSVDGSGDVQYGVGTLVVLKPGVPANLHSVDGARVMLLGGEPFPEKRLIYWNFVASTAEKLEAAKTRWREERFPLVPGDEQERIPLPPE